MATSIKEALARLGMAVLDSIKEAGILGAPGGVIYAALMAKGASLQQYESFMNGLVGNGLVQKEGDCYTITSQGEVFLGKLHAKFGG